MLYGGQPQLLGLRHTLRCLPWYRIKRRHDAVGLVCAPSYSPLGVIAPAFVLVMPLLFYLLAAIVAFVAIFPADRRGWAFPSPARPDNVWRRCQHHRRHYNAHPRRVPLMR